MRPNSKHLALRDPAAAALLGVLAVQGGASFGSDFGDDYGDEAGDESFGFDFGDDYGDDYGGFEFGAAAPRRPARRPAHAHPAHPANSHPEAAKAWAMHKRRQSATAARERLIDPNKGSATKVELYGFAVNATIALGTAGAINASGQPDVSIRPQRVTINAPAYGFITVAELKVANVSVSVGGTQDAYDYNANGVGQRLDMPTLSPANRATFLGNYTGFVPPGYVGAMSYLVCVTLKGPATIVA